MQEELYSFHKVPVRNMLSFHLPINEKKERSYIGSCFYFTFLHKYSCLLWRTANVNIDILSFFFNNTLVQVLKENVGQQRWIYCFWEGLSWFWENGRICLSVMTRVFNRERWSIYNKYFLDFSSLGISQRLQPLLNCFSVTLSTGYKPSGIDFLVWVPHWPQVLLVNQLLDWTPQAAASFKACLPVQQSSPWAAVEISAPLWVLGGQKGKPPCTGTYWTSWGSQKPNSQVCPYQLHCFTSCHLHT